jgi:predicted TIM-barrel fold metal-dependent hydrolase
VARVAYFDASVWSGRWPFAPVGASLAALERELAAQGAEGALVSPAEAVLAPEPQAENLALLAAVRRRRRGFGWLVAAVVDPSRAGWQEAAERCLALGARCLKVLPGYHMYPVVEGGTYAGDAPWVAEAARAGRQGLWGLCRLAAARGVPLAVQMRLQDERGHHPLMRVPGLPAAEVAALAAEHPDARFLACGAYLRDLGPLGAAPNVWVETSFVEGHDTLAQAVTRVPPERLLAGTHAPLFCPGAGVAKLEAATVPAEVREAVARVNARRLWPDGAA